MLIKLLSAVAEMQMLHLYLSPQLLLCLEGSSDPRCCLAYVVLNHNSKSFAAPGRISISSSNISQPHRYRHTASAAKTRVIRIYPHSATSHGTCLLRVEAHFSLACALMSKSTMLIPDSIHGRLRRFSKSRMHDRADETIAASFYLWGERCFRMSMLL